MVFTTRFAGGRARAKTRNGFETELAGLGVEQENSKPNHPQTCGKVEWLQQTQKRWLAAQPVQPATVAVNHPGVSDTEAIQVREASIA
ncbi:hypothetical protein [Actinomycetospora sp. NBRC 106375]|uniref:hypothetical protein n=1 Tax=Actinomycetospora sp. NBRC 106375 TaxID=3032207 RepID=UPI002556BEE2|nr:hypothetical protein [Actinomycetospora sp. NBRC 106375]